MAAYNFHRKILEDPDNSTELAEICTFQCDSLKNPSGSCIPLCSLLICPFNCTTSDSSPPPLPPLPTGDGYVLTTQPPKHHHSSLSLPLKISIIVLVLTFSFFLIYTLYKFYTVWYRSRRRRSSGGGAPAPESQETHDEFLDHDVLDHPIWYIRTIGLQPSVISAITVVKYSKTDGLIDGTDCSVCLSDFQEDETLRLLPKCNHAFHISCIDTWLRSHTNCPLCRAGIVKNTTSSVDSGQIEDTQIAISVTDETDGEQTRRQPEDDDDDDDNQNSDLRVGVVGEIGSGTSDVMRRSVSLNDYAACRIRSDIRDNRNNSYYSDRHDVQIESVDGNLGFELVKTVQTANNLS
ncbi:hypothetical protein SSX86_009631 [Deinandra increscens subsp. villosa]|uniref:RING-type E3 ubiquitin transferase n=1 Tax=Deinandra increscens subsp. villosa TaxID=3103831 RepID=A0AAP0DHA1_9ASTR